MKTKIKAALTVARASAKRDLGIFFVMMILAVFALVIAVPVILVLGFMPEWAWPVLGVGLVIWLVFGDTITATVRAYRSEKP
ncbi:hypothetical protein A9978_18770 [Pseudomonas sp. UMC65]|uniref:hypothetical protein n=1 Tax=Pseudomonas sp. UMC65 TaxID=1862323 RepID=UPI001603AAD6|nr:hypothetical protein [Pseudomonas sp. UMC65]MBB1614485.1 hypothetical protein [Pseudomonas sp. UMC65]